MREILKPLVPMAVAALVMVAPAGAHQVPHKSHLTKTQKIVFYKKMIRHDRQQIRQANHVFRFFEKHSRLLADAQTKTRAWHEIKKWRHIKREHMAQMKFAKTRFALLTALVWPPHHNLWLCVHRGEGRWDDPNSGGNGHWGGLQMTPGWGGLPTGATANNLSQFEQEWLAEHEGAKYSFAHWWLMQQWGADARCF